MRSFLRGIVAGLVLALARVPAGLDLFDGPVAGAGGALLVRALALAVVGLGLWAALHRVDAAVLAGALLGYAAQGLLLAHAVQPASELGLAAALALGLAALLAVCWDERRIQEEPDPPHRSRAAIPGEILGLFAAGAGCALALEAVARHLRLLGAGLAQDDAVHGLTFLAALLAGALALGWAARSRRVLHLSFPAGLALAATACFVSLAVISKLATHAGLRAHLAAFGASPADRGTLLYDAILAAALLGLPGLALGAALCGARHGRQRCAALAGAAQGLVLFPLLLARNAELPSTEAALHSAQIVPLGAIVAIAGGALAILSAPTASQRARFTVLVATFLLSVVPMAVDVYGRPVFSPWEAPTPQLKSYDLLLDTPEGLITVEAADGGLPVATLDRRPLTTARADLFAEGRRLDAALALATGAREPSARTALLVGQLSPLRRNFLRERGWPAIDRTASWWRAMPRIEKELFEGHEPPAGAPISPAEARARFEAGRYDLVLVTPVPGEVPRWCVPEPPRGPVVVWYELDQPVEHLDLGRDAVLVRGDLTEVSLARVAGVERKDVDAGAGRWVDAGRPCARPAPIAWLGVPAGERDDLRRERARAGLYRRLAQGARTEADRALFEALAALHEAQTASSPFETPAQRLELSDAALDGLRRALLAAPGDRGVRRAVETAGRVLAGKRDVARLARWLEPMEAAASDWTGLAKLLARVDLESLDPESASRRLEPLLVAGEADAELYALAGDARAQAGREPDAIDLWRNALDRAPSWRALERRLAMAEVRAGDPRGAERVRSLLASDPGDAELAAYAGPGPYPPAPEGYVPWGEGR